MDDEWSGREDVVVDFEIDESEHIDKDFLEEYNEFEGVEADIPDDILIEDLEEETFMNINKECAVKSIPLITFVADENVPSFHLEAPKTATTTTNLALVCAKCSKCYRKNAYYEKHIKICGGGVIDSKKKTETSTVKQQDQLSLSAKQLKSSVAGTISSTNEELLTQYGPFVKKALDTAANDPVNNIRVGSVITPGNKITELAKDILDLSNQRLDLVQPVFHDLCAGLFEIIKSCKFSKCGSREGMWRKVHLLSLNQHEKAKWQQILSHTGHSNVIGESVEFASLFQYVLILIVNFIVCFENNKNQNLRDHDSIELKLSDDEQQVIRYVGGYIIFSLIRKYKRLDQKCKSLATSAALKLLASFQIKSDQNIKAVSFLDFTRKWIDMVNRGGLVLISDDVFIMIRRIENCARKLFNLDLIRNYKGEDLRDVMQEILQKDNLVNLSWDSFSRNLPNTTLSNVLKKQIIEKWVDIRARAFVSSYIQVVKRRLSTLSEEEKKSKATLSTQSEVSLRKKLT